MAETKKETKKEVERKKEKGTEEKGTEEGMPLIVSNIKITKESIIESKELLELFQNMKKYDIKNPRSLLPASHWYSVEFKLKNTFAGFANSIRRVLMEEMKVKCLTITEKNIQTDDDFILSDFIIKNINLVPINQELDNNFMEKNNVYLYKYNNTNDIIDVMMSDIKISNKKDSKNVDLEKLIPESCIILVRLRPGKFIKLISFDIEEGYAKNNYAKFTLLDNIQYYPIYPDNVVPFDNFTSSGTRSVEVDPTEFFISFTTSGNISVEKTINDCSSTLIERLNKAKKKVEKFSSSKQETKYYYDENFEVIIQDEMYIYKFYQEYLTLANLVTQQCFLLDYNISFCVPAVSRFDNEIAIIKLIHAEPNKLLISSIEICIHNLEIWRDSILKNIK